MGMESHPEGMLVFVLGEPSPSMRSCHHCAPPCRFGQRAVSGRDTFFLLIQFPFPGQPADELLTGLASDSHPKQPPAQIAHELRGRKQIQLFNKVACWVTDYTKQNCG